MKLSKIALLVLSIAFVPMAQAEIMLKPTTNITAQSVRQIPSDESLIKLAKVQQMDKSFEKTLINKEIFNHFMQLEMVQRSLAFDDKSLSPYQREEAKKIVNNFMEKVFTEQNNAEFRQQAINAYIETAKSVYTQQEVNALIQFYDNPIGQSLIQKQPMVTKQYTTEILPIIQNNSKKVVEKNLPELYKKLDELLKTGKR